MGQDLGRRVVVEKGVEAVGRRVLPRELAADALGEGPVRARLVAQAQKAGVHVGAIAAQPVVGVRARGVDERPVGEDEHERVERVVGVVHDAAAHARGVVGQDPTHHRRIDGGGIGPQAVAQGSEDAVQVASHDARLRPHPPPPVEDAARAPVGSQLHEDVVGHGLAGQGRAGGAERDPASALARIAQQPAHLVEVLRPDHDLRDQPVDRGVDRAAQPVQRPGQHAVGREQATEVPDEDGIGGRKQRVGAQRAGASSPPTGTLNL